MTLPVVKEFGPTYLGSVDEDCIPVNISLLREEEFKSPEDGELIPNQWVLRASLYVPSKNRIYDGDRFVAICPLPGPLMMLVRTRIVPVYEHALIRVRGIAAGTEDYLCRWEAPDDVNIVKSNN